MRKFNPKESVLAFGCLAVTLIIVLTTMLFIGPKRSKPTVTKADEALTELFNCYESRTTNNYCEAEHQKAYKLLKKLDEEDKRH